MNSCYKFLIIGALSAATAFASACSPSLPLPYQRQQILTTLGSEAFTKAMADVLEKDHNVRILKVSFDPQVAVELSNGCQITLKMIYLPPASNGECPHFQGVESTTVCNDSP